jgi:hypothetical protein
MMRVAPPQHASDWVPVEWTIVVAQRCRENRRHIARARQQILYTRRVLALAKARKIKAALR